MRTIHIVGASDDDRHLVRVLVALHNELRSCLRSSVRVGGIQKSRFSNVLLTLLLLTVHLVSTDVDEPLNAMETACLEHHVRSHNVVIGECQTVSIGVVYA